MEIESGTHSLTQLLFLSMEGELRGGGGGGGGGGTVYHVHSNSATKLIHRQLSSRQIV